MGIKTELKNQKITSYKVFMQFVYLQNERVGVEKIFSRECFDKWLSTRKKKIKHPQNSFQRVLYAHIRGVDARKPFPPRVEAELLHLLRKGNPWEELLLSLKLNPFRRPFTQLGYHEKRKETEIPLETALVPRLFDHKITFYDSFFAALESVYPQNVRNKIINTSRNHGYDFHAPAAKFLCSLESHPDDLRFRPDFLLPDEPLEFSDLKPIGMAVISSDWIIEYVNPIAKALSYGATVVGRHSFDFSTMIGEMFTKAHCLVNLFTKGAVWNRQVLLLPNGKFEVLHGKWSVFEQNSEVKYVFQFQVATHLYTNLRLHPFL